MDNRFRFRVWDKSYNKMIYNDLLPKFPLSIGLNGKIYGFHYDEDNIEENESEIGEYPERFIAMQYTGLKDKKQKLIYESDICKFEYCNNKYIGKIVFNKNTCALEMWNNIIVGAYGGKATNARLLCHLDNIEVIGNIYENPELLND